MRPNASALSVYRSLFGTMFRYLSPSRGSVYLLASTASVGLNLSSIQAQTTSSPATTTMSATDAKTIPVEPAEREKPIELSPFNVQADDKGYYASNALSGTRFNTKLENLAAPITVVTRQQLDDTAAVDINDIFRFESNTEGTAQFTQFSIDRGNIVDTASNTPQQANRIRGLGAANVTQNGFTMNSLIPIDSYNLDSVEISRGPNSTIAGLGGSSGTINLNTASALLTRDFTRVQGRVDSYGGWRDTWDVNRRILAGRLALRVVGMNQDVGYERKPSYDRTNRITAAITARPFEKTTIKFSFEDYNNNNKRPNLTPPRDAVSYWKSMGSPTWDPITQTVTINGVAGSTRYPVGTGSTAEIITLPLGLTSLVAGGLGTRINEFIDNGRIALLSQGRLSTNNNPGGNNSDVRYLVSGTNIQRAGSYPGLVATPLYNMPVITDKSLYDWTSINFQSPNVGKDYARIYNGELDQNFFDTGQHRLDGQFAWRRENFKSTSRNFIGNGTDGIPGILYVDVNQRLLDGTPNPYFLRPFVAGNEPQVYVRPIFQDSYRGQLGFQEDFTHKTGWSKWLGHHVLTGFGEYDLKKAPNNVALRYRDQVVDPHGWANLANIPGNTNEHLFPRYYVGDANGQNVDYGAKELGNGLGTSPYYWYDGTPGIQRWNTENVNIQNIYFALGMSKTKIRTDGFVLQDLFLDDRLVTTFGFRRDRQLTEDNLATPLISDPANPNYGLIDSTNLKNFGTNKRWTAGNTNTKGVVLKVMPWLHLSYNQSDSFVPSDTQYNLFGEALPNPTGKSKDYGLTLILFEGKLIAKVNKYKTFDQNARGSLGVVATRAIRLDFINSTSVTPDAFSLTNLITTSWVPNFASLTATQQAAAIQKYTGLTTDFISNVQNKAINDVNDATSKGYEFELNYNPNDYLTMKLTAAEQQAIDSNLSPAIQKYIDLRTPFWTTIVDPTTGTPWWTTSYNGTRPVDFYTGNVSAPYKLGVASAGKAKPQTREWSFNYLASYRLAGMFDNPVLKRFTLGGAYHWASRGAIGYMGKAPESDGVIRDLDANRPVYDKARGAMDLFAKYDFKFYSDKIKASIQLNVNNVLESGRLQPIAVNPDGTPWNYRIIDPRQFIVSMTLAM